MVHAKAELAAAAAVASNRVRAAAMWLVAIAMISADAGAPPTSATAPPAGLSLGLFREAVTAWPARILIVGCGEGAEALSIARFRHVVCVDEDDELLLDAMDEALGARSPNPCSIWVLPAATKALRGRRLLT